MHVLRLASYFGFPIPSGVESFHALDQLHEPSIISLLKVTLISTTPGETSLVPASGKVFTITGAVESMSCARLIAVKWHSAAVRRVASNVFVFMVLFFGFRFCATP